MLTKTPAKGMRDFLPDEFAVRQNVLSIIQKTYESYGFTRIETPCVENIELLTSKQGGDNEKLIFKILKRGEKLENASENELCDLGLRYDLTVPLARFYANNCGNLPSVFKAMQMDNVWRADRPQKGRFRQFMQCDIDIIGEETNLAETELITATSNALANLGFNDITIRINDRRLLNALADKFGFSEEERSQVFISLDKLDKIGVTGILEEIEQIVPGKSIAFVDTINRITSGGDSFARVVAELGDYLPENVRQSLEQIMYVCGRTVKNGKLVFDITLVRGMGYYTGTIYEVSIEGFGGSVAGGGRYDKMIGRFTGVDTPACGFSIGFERIALLLAERQLKVNKGGSAVIVSKNMSMTEMADAVESCKVLRQNGRVLMQKRIKNFGYQLQQIKDMGYTDIYEYREGKLVKLD